jgi:hypothetical protein
MKPVNKVPVVSIRLTVFLSGRNQGDALAPLLLKSVLHYAIRKVQENQVGLKLWLMPMI